jgi:hypothetical protein
VMITTRILLFGLKLDRLPESVHRKNIPSKSLNHNLLLYLLFPVFLFTLNMSSLVDYQHGRELSCK